jgi:2'-5' RNA ligase
MPAMTTTWARGGLLLSSTPLQAKAGLLPEPEGTGQGVMVALMIPADVAARIAQPGGLDPADLHLTLAYLGNTADLDGVTDPARLAEALAAVAADHPPVVGVVKGIGRFGNTGEDGDAVWTTLGSPELDDLRADVLAAVRSAGVEAAGDHGFMPHVTLGYLDPDEDGIPVAVIRAVDVTVPELTLAWAGTVTALPFTGDDAPPAAVELR